MSEQTDFQRAAVQSLFDPEYYVRLYPDVYNARIDPLDHYLTFGWREGRNPCASFSTNFYLKANPDVQHADLCPLVHYALLGATEGRLPLDPPEIDPIRQKLEEVFDTVFYSRQYPDVSDELLDHYLNYGWREERNPNATFDTKFYLEEYPDVHASGVCPLLHYVIAGMQEGRTTKGPRPPLSVINSSKSLKRKAEEWKQPQREIWIPSAGDVLCQELAKAASGLILSISHDDYRASWGAFKTVLSSRNELLLSAVGFTCI